MSDFNVGFVIFPDITQLDFTGPFFASRGSRYPAARRTLDLTKGRRRPACGTRYRGRRAFPSCAPTMSATVPPVRPASVRRPVAQDHVTLALARLSAPAAVFVSFA